MYEYPKNAYAHVRIGYPISYLIAGIFCQSLLSILSQSFPDAFGVVMFARLLELSLLFTFFNCIIALPSILLNSSNSLSAIKNSSLSFLTEDCNTKLVCDSVFYCSNLNYGSCHEALQGIWIYDSLITFVNRSAARRGANIQSLPWRLLSSDATCAVEFSLEPGTPEDYARPMQLYWAAMDVLSTCVAGKHNVGGIMKGRGQYEKLTVSVKRYAGPQVHCNPPAPGEAEIGGKERLDNKACLAVLDFMPTDSKFQTYAVAGSRPVDVELPKTYEVTMHGETCRVTVSSRVKSVRALNWEIWDAAMKVNALCARQGLSDIAPSVGHQGKLEVFVIPTRRKPS